MLRLYGGSSGSFARLNLFGSKPRRRTTAASSPTLFYSVAGLSVSTAMQQRAASQIRFQSKHFSFSGVHCCRYSSFRRAKSHHGPTAAGTSIDSYYHQYFSTNSSHYDFDTYSDNTDSCLYDRNTGSDHIPTSSPGALFSTPPGTTSDALATIIPGTAAYSTAPQGAVRSRGRQQPEQRKQSRVTLSKPTQAEKPRWKICWLCHWSCFLPDFDIQFLLCLPQASKIYPPTTPWFDIHRRKSFQRPEFPAKALNGSSSDAKCLEPLI
ncbi:hypothetical protein B0H17DRAFT_96759 [Mycena rosella]|uniref:Uncharacterized protein n=1 Tax=Mycena rosella TaxID=1033263 RepID=A0AAD7GNS6_MYCRO|nr:hypothetical protein B0H17DRAFT_96759 [Mycena rosella]